MWIWSEIIKKVCFYPWQFLYMGYLITNKRRIFYFTEYFIIKVYFIEKHLLILTLQEFTWYILSLQRKIYHETAAVTKQER